MIDEVLLRRYEPISCFTFGELFFPAAVNEYIDRCSLWIRNAKNERRELAPAGTLTPEKLAGFAQAPAGHSYYLQYVAKPMDALRYQQWRHRPNRPIFFAPGRLARVGLFSRIADSFFDLSLLVRGTVPGGTIAVAERQYAAMQQVDPRRVYYGRVLREGGYVILHYLFFFVMNDWRSGFYGVNDHEADWEQVFIYLTDDEEPKPCWVAYASHDFSGDDLRRRWDDPELHKVGTHPLIYVGAGSHASYFLPGEYLTSVEPVFLRPIGRVINLLVDFWRNTLGQGDGVHQDSGPGWTGLTRFPFVDYARGDGLRIGPGQDAEWTPILISDDVGWVDRYRGLWGLDTRDPLGGERAPSGPKYNRDGSVRMSWFNPLGWAGLDKVVPPNRITGELEAKIAQLDQEIAAIEAELEQTQASLRMLALEVGALVQSEYGATPARLRQATLAANVTALQGRYARRTELSETREACVLYLEHIRRGDLGPPQAHLRHKHVPASPVHEHHRAAEVWSAISGGLLILGVVALVTFSPAFWVAWLVIFGVFFFAIEAAVRGRLANYLLDIAIGLAVITTAVLVFEFWWLILIALLLALVIFIIRENLSELRFGASSGGEMTHHQPVDGQPDRP